MEIVMIKHLRDMNKLYSLVLAIFLGVALNTNAQLIKNGDLDGHIDGVSSLPNDWEPVPHTDNACHADEEFETTPDLANEDGFSIVEGIRGKARSGSSFVTGLDYGPGKHHEGIQQKISGLKPGTKYKISFFQAVIKQYNALDKSGSWAVYLDNQLITVTETSSSDLHYDDVNIKWDQRIIEFEASKRNHVLKFLPADDDQVYNYDTEDGNLRMGIDQIEFTEEEIEEPIVDTPIDTTTIDDNAEVISIPDTNKLDVIKLITEIDPVTDSVHYELKEPKEVIFQRPGPLDFQIIAEMDKKIIEQMTAPGAFRVVTKEHDYTLTITDMMGRVLMKKENCTHEEAVALEKNGHFLVIIEKGRYKAAKKLIVQS